MIFEKQLTRKPVRYPKAQEFITAMWDGHWTPEEFDFESDVHDFKTTLTPEDQQIIVRALTAISQIEIAVKSFWGDLGKHLPHPILSDLGYVMAHIEVIHNQAYEKLLDRLGIEDSFIQLLNEPIMRERVQWLNNHKTELYKDNFKKQFLRSLIIFTLYIENVSLFSQFYIMLWYNRKYNVLKDTTQQIHYTKNEETLHANVGIYLINKIKEEYPELVDEAFEQEIAITLGKMIDQELQMIDWILGDNSPLNKVDVFEFIIYRSNKSLYDIGIATIEPQIPTNSLWMIEEIKGNTLTDFFYRRPVEYSKNINIDPNELF